MDFTGYLIIHINFLNLSYIAKWLEYVTKYYISYTYKIVLASQSMKI